MSRALNELLQNGGQLLRARRIADAKQVAETLLRQHPDEWQVRLFAADTADAAGEQNAAIAQLDALPEAERAKPVILLRRAQLLYSVRRRREALAAVAAAGAVIEHDPWQYRTLARILADCLEVDSARDWLERGHARFPASVPILFDLALAEFQLNLVDASEAHLDSLLAREPFHAGAIHLRSMLRTQTLGSNHVAELDQRLAAAGAPPALEVACCFALAKEHEDLGHYQESFETLARGARVHRATLRYDSAAEQSSLAAVRASFTPAAARTIGAGFEDEAPIFVIGMPRTGTTLVERILDSHSDVRSIGELTDFPLLLTELVAETMKTLAPGISNVEASLRIDYRELGRRYSACARELAGDSPRFVDKLPYNFLYCGYILAALPKARLLHLRRDPLDTCYAVYKTRFFRAYNWSYDLEEIAAYYIAYRRQMAHWHAVLPGRILDIDYEDLVREPAKQARRILDWCDLPWQDGVLEFHKGERAAMTASAAQVRRPMHTDSIGAARRAGIGLAGLAQRLREAGVLDAQPA